MRNSILAASLLALAVASPAALAHKEGDIIVRAGAITVDPHEDSGEVHVGGAAVAGTKATLDSDTQLGLNFALSKRTIIYAQTGQLELKAATKVQVSGSALGIHHSF